MLELLDWLLFEVLPVFLLVLVRLTSFFMIAPIFALQGVPNTFKLGLAFFIALISFSTLTVESSIVFDLSYVFYILKEVAIGLSIGFVAALLVYTSQIAGAIIDFQMGFMMANLVDPQTGAQIPVMGNFKYIITILFLLSVDGHLMMLEGVMRSYEIVAVDTMFVPLGSDQMAGFITDLFVQVFLIAFQIALPIAGSLFLVEISLGVLARTVPQVNVFVVGLPIKILLGLILLFITLPVFIFALHGVSQRMIEAMGQMIQILGG